MRVWIVALAMVVSGGAWAEPWDAAVQRLCVSLDQQDCWVKSGASLCDRAQSSCKRIPDHAPAIILGHADRRWNVKTQYGSGWVSDRLMMLDSSKTR